jgi:hypothetical protein
VFVSLAISAYNIWVRQAAELMGWWVCVGSQIMVLAAGVILSLEVLFHSTLFSLGTMVMGEVFCIIGVTLLELYSVFLRWYFKFLERYTVFLNGILCY